MMTYFVSGDRGRGGGGGGGRNNDDDDIPPPLWLQILVLFLAYCVWLFVFALLVRTT